MKNEKSSGHGVALLNQLLDVLLWADRAPTSPIEKFHSSKERRELRRNMVRLRAGQAAPDDRTLTAEELAGIYERTIRRDDIVERAYIAFKRLNRELGRVLQENDPEEQTRLVAFLDEMQRAAQEHGVDSEAGRRFEHLRILGWFSQQHKSKGRRRKDGVPPHLPMVLLQPVEARSGTSEAEDLPPYGSASGPARVFLRTDAGGGEWIGISDRAFESVNSFHDLPDGNHLVITAKRTGYIIDADCRTLAEEIDAKVVEVIHDEQRTLFFIHRHDGRVEAFGNTGRLWKTDPITAAEFRNPSLTDQALYAEAPCSCGGWVEVAVDVATGEVLSEEQVLSDE